MAADENKGTPLVILGVIAVIAIIGLVLMFSGAKKSAGAIPTVISSDLPSGMCDSPCTLAFGGNEAEVAMQTQRFLDRGFVYVGIGGVTYSVDGYQLALPCLCPPDTELPQFMATEEYAAIIGYRSTGTPVPMDVPSVEMPYQKSSAPGYPYPASINK